MAPIALAFGVLELGGSAGDLGLVLTLSILPQVFFLLAGGVIADRLRRHIVMVASNLVSGAAQAVAAVLLISGAAEIWQLAVVAVVRAVASSFFFPAQQGIIPQTVPVEILQPANALLRLTLNATNIGGAALGGLIVAAAGPGWALAFDAFTYVAAAALLLPMHIVQPARAATESFFAELREGWTAFSSRTWLWVVVLGFGRLRDRRPRERGIRDHRDALGLCRGRDRRTRRPARLAGGAGAAAPRSAARGSAGGSIGRS